MVFSIYSVLWATITHEIMALYNSFDVDLISNNIRGIRSFSVTIWWTVLAGLMIFIGVTDDKLVNHKNIGFGLLAITIFKLLFIDLFNINTNLKVFIFLTVGILMLVISYVANNKEQEQF